MKLKTHECQSQFQSPHRAPGRPREFDMDEALDKAIAVFSERGFHATSIADLSEAMDLTAGSIYKAFKDKRAVFVAALERQMSLCNIRLLDDVALASSGREKVCAALCSFANKSYGAEGRLGCLVVGTAMELAIFDAEIARHVVNSLHGREKVLTSLIRLGQADGSISTAVDTKSTAHFMLCLMQGLRVVGKTSPTRVETMAAVEAAMKVLD